MIRYALLLLLVAAPAQLARAEEPSQVTMPRSGYTLKTIDPGLAPKDAAFESFRMLLPPKDGFASNINIQHQHFTGTMEEYLKLSQEEAKLVNMEMTNSKVEDGIFTSEATARLPGVPVKLRFYFKAIKSGDNVILATAAIPTDRWDDEKDLLLPVVNSLMAVQSKP